MVRILNTTDASTGSAGDAFSAVPQNHEVGIRELYAAYWKIWFPEEGDPRHGTAEDPRFVLIGVDIHAAVFLEVDKPTPVVLFEIAKGWITGSGSDIGKTYRLEEPHRA